MTPAPQPHRVDWTPEAIERFWNFRGTRPSLAGRGFAAMAGDDVILHAKRLGMRLEGHVLDYGCGSGALTEKLLARGATCTAADASADSLHALRERIGAHPRLHAAVQTKDFSEQTEDKVFDGAFLLDTIEHLPDDARDTALTDIARSLKPGGLLIVTTPHDENLESGEVCCPECGCIFHERQHLSRWTPDTLATCIEAYGFATRVCYPTMFFKSSFRRWIRLGWKLLGLPQQNLLYAGVKRKD